MSPADVEGLSAGAAGGGGGGGGAGAHVRVPQRAGRYRVGAAGTEQNIQPFGVQPTTQSELGSVAGARGIAAEGCLVLGASGGAVCVPRHVNCSRGRFFSIVCVSAGARRELCFPTLCRVVWSSHQADVHLHKHAALWIVENQISPKDWNNRVHQSPHTCHVQRLLPDWSCFRELVFIACLVSI